MPVLMLGAMSAAEPLRQPCRGCVPVVAGIRSKAGVYYVVRHGPVADRDVLSAEVSTRMQQCVGRHTARKASTECVLCHQLGQ